MPNSHPNSELDRLDEIERGFSSGYTPDVTRELAAGWRAALSAQEAAERERDEALIGLRAWHSQFETTQLSHAIAGRDMLMRHHEQALLRANAAESQLAALRSENAGLREAAAAMHKCVSALSADFGTRYPALAEAHVRLGAALASPAPAVSEQAAANKRATLEHDRMAMLAEPNPNAHFPMPDDAVSEAERCVCVFPGSPIKCAFCLAAEAEREVVAAAVVWSDARCDSPERCGVKHPGHHSSCPVSSAGVFVCAAVARLRDARKEQANG